MYIAEFGASIEPGSLCLPAMEEWLVDPRNDNGEYVEALKVCTTSQVRSVAIRLIKGRKL